MLIVAHRFIINIDSYLMTVSYNGTLFKPLQSVYVKRYWLIIFIFINRQFNEIHKHRFVEMFGEVKKQQFTNFSNHPSANTKIDNQHRSPYTLVVV